MDFSYKFPAVKGKQAGKQYFITMIPLRLIDRLFGNDEEYVPPEYRAQRRLNESRIPAMRDYVLNNRDSYVFSALAASIDGEFMFSPEKEDHDIGILEVSMDARFMIIDGQHRKAAIHEALVEDASLGEETISVVMYADEGLAHSQQMFTDLNKHAVKTSNSIAELYDSRDSLAVITRRVINSIDFLNQYTDKERDILGKFSSNFFTLNAFYKANKKIISRYKATDEEIEKFLAEYWSTVADHIVPWQELSNKAITKVDLREHYIVTQAIVIQGLGFLGNKFALQFSLEDMKEKLQGLENVDWSRTANCWKKRVIRDNGKIINSTEAARCICDVLTEVIGI